MGIKIPASVDAQIAQYPSLGTDVDTEGAVKTDGCDIDGHLPAMKVSIKIEHRESQLAVLKIVPGIQNHLPLF